MNSKLSTISSPIWRRPFSYTTGEVQSEYEKVEEDALTLSGDDLEDDSTKGKWLSRLAKVGECVTEITVSEYMPMLPEWMFKKRNPQKRPSREEGEARTLRGHHCHGSWVSLAGGFQWRSGYLVVSSQRC